MQLGCTQARTRRRGPAALTSTSSESSSSHFVFYFCGTVSSALSCTCMCTTSDRIPHLSQQECFVHVHAAKNKMSVNRFNRFGCFNMWGMDRMVCVVCKSASCVCFRVNLLLAFAKSIFACGFQFLCNSRASSQNLIACASNLTRTKSECLSQRLI